MKKLNRNYFLRRAFGIGLCLFLSVGLTPAMAQDDADDEEVEEVVKKKRVVVSGPTYEMKQVSGTVLDAATKQPIAGVRIQALNDYRYTAMTGEDGKYTLSIPTFVTALYISTPEYNPVQVPVRAEAQTTNLYSSVFKSFYEDGNVTFRKQETVLENTSAVTVEQDIENALNASVRTVSRGGLPGQGVAMFINGLNSLNTTAQPLVVIDGIPLDMQYDRNSIHQGFFNNVFNTIDVDDIDKVRVLNSGTALYGAKGGNGVIEITTKRGHSRATRIDARIYGGFEVAPTTLDVLDGRQYRSYMSDILGTYTSSKPAYTASALQALANSWFMKEDPEYTFYNMFHNNQDWQKDLYQTAFTQNYKVNVQGGDEIAMYSLSLGYTMADATAKNNDFDRLSIRFNTDINMFENFITSFDLAYGRTTSYLRDNGWAADYTRDNIGSPNVLGLLQPSMLSKYSYFLYWDKEQMKNIMGSSNKTLAGKEYTDANNPFTFATAYGTDPLANPYWILANGEGDNKNYQEQTQFILNINPHYEATPWLTIGNRFSYVLNRTSELYYLPWNGVPSKYVADLNGSVRSSVKSQYGDESSISNNFYVNFHRQMGAHNLNAVGGFRFNSFDYSDSYLFGYNNTNDKMPNMSTSLSHKSYGGTSDRWVNLAYYLDAQYNYKNRYFVDATLTSESSSRFGKNASEGVKLFGVKWGLFPALRAAWLISNEDWFHANSGINYLKLSAGYEESGNDNIDYYAARTYFSNDLLSGDLAGLSLANIANSAIQWETTRRFNVGLESSLLDNRLNLGLNFFWSTTSNLLAKENLSYLTGLPSMWTNNGALKNSGFDIHANAILVNADKFKWSLGFSVGHYRNEITKLPTSTLTYYNLDADGQKASIARTVEGYTSSIYGVDNILTTVGNAAGVFYGYKTAGVFATDEQAANAGKYGYLRYPTGYVGDPYRYFKAGDVHFIDQNGDGWISEADLVEIGDPNPDIYGNIFTSVNFCKNFTLDVIFKYSLGNDIYNYQASQLESQNNLWNQTSAAVNRWTHEGQVTDMPRAVLVASDQWVNNERFSDRWIEDGSYLKMKKVRLTYRLPLSLSWLQGLTVWGEANNVFTLTKYRGLDPEVSCGNSVLLQGIDAGMLPQSRSFNFGVTINL